MTRPLSIVALCALVAVGAGCGDLGGDTRPEPRLVLVTRAQLERFPKDGPARAFLGWFRALQVSDSKAAARYYSSSLGITAGELAIQRRRGAYAVEGLASPVIVRAAETGSRAVVVARFRAGEIAPNGRVDLRDTNAVSFYLTREAAGWRLTNNRFLELVSRMPTQTTKPPKPAGKSTDTVVSRADLARFSQDSPARTFLEWFRALQRGKSAAAARYYLPSLKITGAIVARQRRVAGAIVDSFAVPRISRARVNGDRGSVTVVLRVITSATGAPVEVVERKPVVFTLRLTGGAWKLTTNDFLEILSQVPSS